MENEIPEYAITTSQYNRIRQIIDYVGDVPIAWENKGRFLSITITSISLNSSYDAIEEEIRDEKLIIPKLATISDENMNAFKAYKKLMDDKRQYAKYVKELEDENQQIKELTKEVLLLVLETPLNVESIENVKQNIRNIGYRGTAKNVEKYRELIRDSAEIENTYNKIFGRDLNESTK